MTAFKPNLLALAVLTAGIATQAQAGESIDMGNGLTLDWKGTVSYGAGVRLEDPKDDVRYLRSVGNRNFDQGDLINNRLSLLMEGRLHKGNSGLVMSASTFYDDVYQGDKFTDDAEKFHGGYTRLLDFYGYTGLDLGGGSYLDIRAGKHVVAWGEALFMPSISLAQGPSDGTKSGIPGVEVKDILLPEDQVSMQLEVNPNWSIMAHAQYNWHPVMASEAGTFLSAKDAIGDGATCFVGIPDPANCSYGVRRGDIEPDETGQWGIGTRFRTSLETEWGLYYLNYHDRIPLTEFTFTGYTAPYGYYDIRYFDDIELYGATMTTSLGMASVAAEVTYKKGAPVLVSTEVPYVAIIPSAARGDILQTNVNAIVNFGRSWIADTVNLTAELSYVDILDVEARGMNGVPGGETDDLYFTGHGLAFASSLSLSYPGFTENWDLSVPLAYSRQLSGRTITGGVGAEGDHRFSIGADFTHRTGLQVGVKYLTYMGSAADSDAPYEEVDLTDRDNLSLSVKYAF